ncbi:MAG: hypothetical protein ABSH39_23040 [Candidatus Acidiferrum sp.]|jgi:hypothetical protein
MSDWSTNAAGRVRQQQQNNNIRDARALQEERLLDEYAPSRWEELRNTLMQMCSDFNAEAGMRNSFAYDNSNPDGLKVEYIPKAISARVTFSRERHEIKVGGLIGPAVGELVYKIAVVPGQRETYFLDGNNSIQAHEIARNVLDRLLGI